MDWTRGGRDRNLLSNTLSAMQYIAYRWELIKVTLGDYERQTAAIRREQTADQLREAAKVDAGKGESTVKTAGPLGISSGEAADVERAFKNIVEDTSADVRDMSSVPWALRYQYLQVIALSVSVRALGALLKEFTTRITMPENEQRISFGAPGDYVVRCIATPLHSDTDRFVRASSIASYPVRVETVRDRARLADQANEREIAGLETQLKGLAPGKAADDLKAEIEARKLQASSTHLENTNRRLAQLRDDLKLAEDLKGDVDAGRKDVAIGTDPYAVKKRWLAVNLAQAHIKLEDYIADETRMVDSLKDTAKRLDTYGRKGAIEGASWSPRVTLASEENGATYQLLMVLSQTKSLEKNKVVEYRLADVTTHDAQQEYLGESKAPGAEGHREAIRAAFVNFRENNGYGRGTIVIRLPKELDENSQIAPLPMEREMRSAPGQRERALQKLKDIATAAEIAGMIVGGPAGLAIGIAGGVAGLTLTAENIRKRVTGDRFEWASFETLMDVISIVGSTVGIGAGVSGAVRAAGSTARWAVTAEKLFVPIMKGQLIVQVVILPSNAYVQFAKLEEQIKNAKPPMTEGEIALRRAEIATSFAWGAFTTSVSAAQMMGMPTLIGEHPTSAAPGHDTAPPTEHETPSSRDQPSPHEEHELPPTRDPSSGREPVTEEEPAGVRSEQPADEVVSEAEVMNSRNEPHEMHRTRDGRIYRCSGECMPLLDNVRARVGALRRALAEGHPLLERGRKLIERAERLQAHSNKTAADQARREAYIKTLPEGSPSRARSENALERDLKKRNEWFELESRRLETALSELENDAGIQVKGDLPAPPSPTKPEQPIHDFNDVAGDPKYKAELDAIKAIENDKSRTTEVAERLGQPRQRMLEHVEGNISDQVLAARQARERVGEGATGPDGGALASSGDGATHCESGWADYHRPGIEQATDSVRKIGEQMHYDFPAHKGFDRGVAGRYYASHAEKQLQRPAARGADRGLAADVLRLLQLLPCPRQPDGTAARGGRPGDDPGFPSRRASHRGGPCHHCAARHRSHRSKRRRARRPCEVSDLAAQIDAAAADVDARADGQLIRGRRQAILRSFGDAAEGRARRAQLARRTVEHVMPLWQGERPGDTDPEHVLHLIDGVLDGSVSENEARRAAGGLWAHIDNLILTAGEELPLHVGYAASRALLSACLDEPLDPPNADPDRTDDDVDPRRLDTAFMASIAAAGGDASTGEGDVARRREFWHWWLGEASHSVVP